MEIYRIEQYKKTRFKIYLDDSKRPSFMLYAQEVRKYGLKEGMELEAGIYDEILNELLIKRARQRALYLLDDYSRTEAQLRNKLREGFYPDEAIDAAVEYAKSKHYLDDAYYAQEFAAVRTRKKSRRMVEMEMASRGIDRDTIAEAMDRLETDEVETVCGLIKKKCSDVSLIDNEKKNKMIRNLISRGFSYDDCKEAFDRLTEGQNNL